MIKKNILKLASIVTVLVPTGALAYEKINPSRTKIDVEKIIVNVINYILYFGVALTVLFIIYGGIMYMVSGGEEEKKKKGRSILTSAVIGLIIILLALVIVNFIDNFSRDFVS